MQLLELSLVYVPEGLFHLTPLFILEDFRNLNGVLQFDDFGRLSIERAADVIEQFRVFLQEKSVFLELPFEAGHIVLVVARDVFEDVVGDRFLDSLVVGEELLDQLEIAQGFAVVHLENLVGLFKGLVELSELVVFPKDFVLKPLYFFGQLLELFLLPDYFLLLRGDLLQGNLELLLQLLVEVFFDEQLLDVALVVVLEDLELFVQFIEAHQLDLVLHSVDVALEDEYVLLVFFHNKI